MVPPSHYRPDRSYLDGRCLPGEQAHLEAGWQVLWQRCVSRYIQSVRRRGGLMQFKVWKIKVYGSDLVPGDITKLGNIIHISKHLGSVSALVTLNGESKTAVIPQTDNMTSTEYSRQPCTPT